MLKLKSILIIFVLFISSTVKAGISFKDDFEKGIRDTGKWDLVNAPKVQVEDSGDPAHGKVMVLYAGAPVHALVKGSEVWTDIKVEGDVLFPEKEHNYMGLIYNYNVRGPRVDYGCIYIKGNGSYIRVNPHRDYQVSRTIYEEYKTALTGDSAVTTGKWQHFKAEIMGPVCHFYVGDMKIPKVTFNFLEFSSGRVGFEPRIRGSECWLDNISIESISRFNYKGPLLPAGIHYNPERLITQWDVIGPFRRPKEEIEKDGFLPEKTYSFNNKKYRWQRFEADGRGCVVSGRLFEFDNYKWFGYFHTQIPSAARKNVTLQFATTNVLTVWLNGNPIGKIKPTYNAWYDFRELPGHKESELKIRLEKGMNHLLIFAEGVGKKYTGDGFFARIETDSES